jgi:hypothetical protein
MVNHKFPNVFSCQHCSLDLRQIGPLADVLDNQHPQIIPDFLDLWDWHRLHDWPRWPME